MSSSFFFFLSTYFCRCAASNLRKKLLCTFITMEFDLEHQHEASLTLKLKFCINNTHLATWVTKSFFNTVNWNALKSATSLNSTPNRKDRFSFRISITAYYISTPHLRHFFFVCNFPALLIHRFAFSAFYYRTVPKLASIHNSGLGLEQELKATFSFSTNSQFYSSTFGLKAKIIF